MSGLHDAAHHAIAGILIDGPCHGYALRQRFTSALGPIWRLPQSQLYAILHRLEEQGWVSSQRRTVGGRPPRTVYAATPAGARAALTWARAPVRRARDIRVEFPAKLYILRRVAPHHVHELLERQHRALQRLEERFARQVTLPSDDPIVGALALDLRRRQVAALRGWVERCSEVLQSHKEESDHDA